ncbi:MAG: GNAT family N-acetyltransferase [Polyangiaceae bacterium]
MPERLESERGNAEMTKPILRAVIESDLRMLFEHQRDPIATQMAAFLSRDWDAFAAHWRRVLGDPTNCKRTVLVGDAVAGDIGSWNQGDERLVGYWFGRAYWGRGIATAALAEFLLHDTARPLHAYVATHNVASIRVLEKCRFRRVGDGHVLGDEVREHRFRLDG